VAFYVVYIAEAHPTDEWQVESNESDGVLLTQHTDFADRKAAAVAMEQALELGIPQLIDGMDDAASEAFSAWPERIYIVGADGAIAYRGGPGPFEFYPDEARAALVELVG
jgi:hypothetical protein